MSAQVVAVSTLLLDVLDRLRGDKGLTGSEERLVDLLGHREAELLIIRQMATAEMNALAPAVLVADAAWSGVAA